MKTLARHSLLALLLFACAGAPPLAAQAGLLVPTSTGQPDASVLSLREMEIQVGIARGYARVSVRQVFENHTDTTQEGTYRFRLPLSATVGDFAVWDGLTRIPGVVVEKRRARAIYKELTTQRIDPGLLQQGEEEDATPGEPGTPGSRRPSGGSLFSVSVSPVPARATKRLELQFQQEVPYIEGQGELRLGLRPPDGEPPIADSLRVRVVLEDGTGSAPAGALALKADGRELSFSGTRVTLNKDLVVRFKSSNPEALRVSAFRNPDGVLPDGLRLAPWERPGDVPPEKDGFFLLEAFPPLGAKSTASQSANAASRPPVTLVVVFDTSLSQRWTGLESAYGQLTRVLASLGPKDRFALVSFDRAPFVASAMQSATHDNVEAALGALRARPLQPGSDLIAALVAGRKAAGDNGRLVLFTDALTGVGSQALNTARAGLPLFTSLSGEELPESLRSASAQVLAPGTTEIESDLFFRRVVEPIEKASTKAAPTEGWPFKVSGGDAHLRDVYPVLAQPLHNGSLSGWVGRYAEPQPALTFELPSSLFKESRAQAQAALPEKALEARDLPRRWARARVDHLLALIEAEGERREWVDEIIALSKRYNFVTPYTAFLAAPRSLLRPRRIQPGDPVLRVECDPGIVSATALFPFGLRLQLERRPGTSLWEGRFLVPEGLKDGRYEVRIVLRDKGGARLSENKHFVLDGQAPQIRPDIEHEIRAGTLLRVAARTDDDVIVLRARLGDGAPVPLRWDDASKRSVGMLWVPAVLQGRQEVFFEAVDGAKNHGFARVAVEVQQ
jgi:Ca-activated chloride channel homolog